MSAERGAHVGEKGMAQQERDARLMAAFRKASKGYKAPRRHPAEVTSDRIADHLCSPLCDGLTGAERDTLSEARYLLERLAEGE